MPELGPNGLIPKYNPEIWQPRENDCRTEKYGQPIMIGKKNKAPNLDVVPAPAVPKPAAPVAAVPTVAAVIPQAPQPKAGA